jgi:hypothetical protein
MAIIKKFICIVKIEKDIFLRYHVNNLLLFVQFLDTKYPNWSWFNVFSNEKLKSKEQVANFTKNNRPTNKHIQI